MKQVLYSVLCFCACAMLFTSCKKDEMAMPPQGPDVRFYAVTSDNRLHLINARNANQPISSVAITGMQSGESMIGIDFRPATGQLFGVGSTSRLYMINTGTGVATAVGSPFSPAISGGPVAFDFNPTVDRIRLVTASGQNLRLNPETGAVAATDGSINGAPGARIHAVAYTNSRAGATSTVLYDIDVTSNTLFRQDPPNNGTLMPLRNDLGMEIEGAGGFDISPDNSTALAAFALGGLHRLFSIDLATGSAVKVGELPGEVVGLAILPEPAGYAVAMDNSLMIFNVTTGATIATKAITGLQGGENILGIDMRPATGQLFALGSSSRLYTINTNTGAATVVGSGPLSTLLTGTAFGFDFNPTVDRIRVVSNTGQNLRLNPNDGTVTAVDGSINPVTPGISASAYTNNFAGATTTVLYNIDAQTGRLVRQDPPNAGTLVSVGALGVVADASNGFDIGGQTGMAYAVLTVSGTTRLYNINLTTGAATAGPTLAPVRGFALGLGW